MTEKENPQLALNMTLAGPWIRAGLARFEVVEHSWFIYNRNSAELVNFLKIPSMHQSEFLRIVTSGPNESWSFWGTFNQRLHNFLASAVSLIDHARRLTDYYQEDATDFVHQFQVRNQAVAELPEAQFLRELRNYMLHCSQPPLITHISFQVDEPHTIKFAARQLLEQQDRPWKSAVRKYLEAYPANDGPEILTDVQRYVEEMNSVFTWLFEQRQMLGSLAPERFLVELLD